MISIIIATKNGSKFLPDAIHSIENQTEKDFEVIVVSDGSTDNTPQIIQDMQRSRPWLRLIELKENVGQGKARNKGILESNGVYIALLDDDDRWLDTEKMATQKDFLDSNSEYVLIGARKIIEIQASDKSETEYTTPSSDKEIRNQFLSRNCFITSSVMFRKAIYLESGGFRHFNTAEDYDLWLRMGRLGKMANLDNCRIEYAVRTSGSSKTHTRDMYRNTITILKENKQYYPGYWKGISKAYIRLLYIFVFQDILPLSKFSKLRITLRKIF